MPYRLIQLAPGSYDLTFDEEIVGSVVCQPASGHRPQKWFAELLDDGRDRPAPFVAAEHEFGTFSEVLAWLGDVEVNRPHRDPVVRSGALASGSSE